MATKKAVRKWLIYGCVHTPYQDEAAYGAMLDFAKYWKPNVVVENGDINDELALTSHRVSPDKVLQLQDEVDEARRCNGLIRKTVGKDTRILRLLGNHGYRWKAYLTKNAPALLGLDSIEYGNVFDLDKYNIELVNERQYGYIKINNDISVGHINTLSPESGYTASRIMRSMAGTVIAHHSHRLGQVYKRYPGNRFVTGVEGGCLCRLDPDWTPNPEPDWQHGFVTVTEMADTGRYFIETIPIIDGNIWYDGRLF